jgi:predicted DNA-binding transcriptional regulator AlpA
VKTNNQPRKVATPPPRKPRDRKAPEQDVTPHGLMRWPAVMRATGLSESTIRRWEDKGTFPRHHHLPDSTIAVWHAEQIDAWCAGLWKRPTQ